MKTAAIVLAAGRGSRMQSDIAKQYMLLDGKPLIYYSLQAFEQSMIDEVVLVTSSEDISYCQEEIVNKYHFKKVKRIVAGGAERYHSVHNGLEAIKECDYAFIHDGARPFVTEDIISRALESVRQDNACVVGMPAKDTIKIADSKGFVFDTPDRTRTWIVQTPQVFSYDLILKAYRQLIEQEESLKEKGVLVTDDAMVVEYFTQYKVKLVEGTYQNIKITTPEDLLIAEVFLKKNKV